MNTNRQIFNTFIIVIGATLVIYDLLADSGNVYIKIIGLVLLMFGLYTATQQWTAGNREQQNEVENDEENAEHK